MYRNVVLLVGLLGALGTGRPGAAAVITLEPARDNTLYWNHETPLSNGGGIGFFAGRSQGPIFQRGLLAFDPGAAIPEGSLVHSVVLTLHVSRSAPVAEDVSLHRLLRNWGEGHVVAPDGEGFGGPPDPGDATWTHAAHDETPWQRPGGDFRATPSAVTRVAGEGYVTWGTQPQLVADVQGWVDEPDTNFGWILIGDELTRGTAKRFSSREDAIRARRPQLTINFTPLRPCRDPLVGDLNDDCRVDFRDLALLAEQWLSGRQD